MPANRRGLRAPKLAKDAFPPHQVYEEPPPDCDCDICRAAIAAAEAGPPPPPPESVISSPDQKMKPGQSPQESIDEFWAKFSSPKPGKALTILPNNLYAKAAGKVQPKGEIVGKPETQS
jgi:hypothetical protein